MKHTLRYGKTVWSYNSSSEADPDFNPSEPCRPNPILTFAPVRINGKAMIPSFGDRHSVLLLKRQMPKQILFPMAYSSWRASGAKEEAELGEGRAFLRWLQRLEVSIAWRPSDFKPHPYFCQKDSPRHDPGDEMALGLSFVIKPVCVEGRKVKLYLQDDAMLSLLGLPYGQDEDFLELVMRYVGQRFQWEQWRAPAPPFLEWVTNLGKRPVFLKGQLGFMGTVQSA